MHNSYIQIIYYTTHVAPSMTNSRDQFANKVIKSIFKLRKNFTITKSHFVH